VPNRHRHPKERPPLEIQIKVLRNIHRQKEEPERLQLHVAENLLLQEVTARLTEVALTVIHLPEPEQLQHGRVQDRLPEVPEEAAFTVQAAAVTIAQVAAVIAEVAAAAHEVIVVAEAAVDNLFY